MIVRTTNDITIEVNFDPNDREEEFPDDIAFALRETGPKDTHIFPSEETRFLLTPKEAKQLATALIQAAEASENLPRKHKEKETHHAVR